MYTMSACLSFPCHRPIDGFDGGIVTTLTHQPSALRVAWTPDSVRLDIDVILAFIEFQGFDPGFSVVYFVNFKPVCQDFVSLALD
jgi:hypothetical protein